MGITFFFKNRSHPLGSLAYSVLVGSFGTILLVLFLATFMHLFEVTRFIPWIMAFNTAITGYTLLDKTGDQIKYKQIYSICAGILNVILAYTILTLIFFFQIGEHLFSRGDLIIFLIIGIICSELGGSISKVV